EDFPRRAFEGEACRRTRAVTARPRAPRSRPRRTRPGSAAPRSGASSARRQADPDRLFDVEAKLLVPALRDRRRVALDLDQDVLGLVELGLVHLERLLVA